MRIPVKTRRIIPKKSSDILTIFFHGLFGGSLDPLCSPEIHALSERLVAEKIVTVGLYETSRNCLRDGRDFFVWGKEAFAGKTFSDEVNDVGIALKKITSAFPSYKKLVFVGFSLGGTLSTYFLDAYHPDAVVMFGSGCTTRNKHVPIGSTYPPKQEIFNNLKNFAGTIKIYQGTKDTIVPKGGAKQMLHAATHAIRRDFIQLCGVDHQFQLRDGKPDKTLRDVLFQEIVAALKSK